MYKYLFVLSAFALFLSLPVSRPVHAEMLLDTSGTVSIAPYLHGINRSHQRYPGYRAEFLTILDIARVHGFVLASTLGTTTIMTDPGSGGMRLDRIRYTLTPSVRYEQDTWLIRGALHHECIHTINRPENNGSTWWNSLLLGIGTKGAFNQFLRESSEKNTPRLFKRFDLMISAGKVIPAKRTLFSGQNHDYEYEQSSLVRVLLAGNTHWSLFAGIRQQLWGRDSGDPEHQVSLTLSLFRRGLSSFAGLFYTYTPYDTFTLDNSDKLGSAGIRIMF